MENTNIINIDTNNKTILISNCSEYTINIQGNINVECVNATIKADDINVECVNATIKADDLNLGDNNGGLVLTQNDTFVLPAGSFNVNGQGATPNLATPIQVTTQTTITKAK